MRSAARLLPLALVLGVTTGCLMQRRYSFPAAAELTPVAPLAGGPQWHVGKVEAFLSPRNAAEGVEWDAGLRQLEARVHGALEGAPGLAERTASAGLRVDVAVAVREESWPNRWFLPAVGVEAALLGGGTFTGYTVARFSGGDPLVGSMVGLCLSVIPALIVPLLLPAATRSGNLEATVQLIDPQGSLVRAGAVATRWTLETNVFNREEKFAAASGEGAVALERAVLEELRRLLEAEQAR